MKAALLVLALVACGASAREKAIGASYKAATVASTALVAYDKTEEDRAVQQATSEADGKTRLAAIRARVDKAEKAIDAAFRTIAAAAALNDGPSLDSMLVAAGALQDEMRALGLP